MERAYPTHLALRDEPLWAGDGNALYFATLPERTIGEAADQKWSFYRLDLNTGSYKRVVQPESAGMVRMAGATKDSIVYLLNTFGKPNTAFILSLDISSGRSVLLYRTEINNISDAALSADGSHLAFLMNQDRSVRLYILPRGQTTPVPITTIRPNNRAQFMWLSTGEAIITSGRINGKQGIWRIPVNGAPPQGLDIPAGNVTEVRLSADGRRIAFTRINQQPRQILAMGSTF